MRPQRVFTAGVICAVAVQSLLQDAAGKEAWLREEASSWITPWITVPLALAALVYALGVLVAAVLKEDAWQH